MKAIWNNSSKYSSSSSFNLRNLS